MTVGVIGCSVKTQRPIWYSTKIKVGVLKFWVVVGLVTVLD